MRCIALVVTLLLPMVCLAQNLLFSPDFDVASDIDDWPDPFPDPDTVISWEPPPMDVDGSSSSGSLRLQNSISNNTSDGPQQCVAVNPSDLYEAEAWVYVPTQVPQPKALLVFYYYPTQDCTGGATSFAFQRPDSSDLDTWKMIQFMPTLPPGTSAVGFRPLSGETFDATPTEVFYDALYFPEPSGLQGIAFGAALVIALGRSRNQGADPQQR